MTPIVYGAAEPSVAELQSLLPKLCRVQQKQAFGNTDK
jgi:hypothetical protein